MTKHHNKTIQLAFKFLILSLIMGSAYANDFDQNIIKKSKTQKPIKLDSINIIHIVSNPKSARAPAKVARLIANSISDRDGFSECKDESKISDSNLEKSFNWKRLFLADSKKNYLVVLRNGRCPNFFGAHAASYWIVENVNPSEYVILANAMGDQVRLHRSRTNGYLNISNHYSWESSGDSILVGRFNGVEYKFSMQ